MIHHRLWGVGPIGTSIDATGSGNHWFTGCGWGWFRGNGYGGGYEGYNASPNRGHGMSMADKYFDQTGDLATLLILHQNL